MSEIIRAALPEAKRRYKEQCPRDWWEFEMAASHNALTDPDNPRNLFYCTVKWPTDIDPYAACDVRINFPKERLKNGQGYIGLTFQYRTPLVEGAYFNTELLLIHGIGRFSLVTPLSASVTEYLSDGIDPTTKPIWTPKSFDEASQVLKHFGLGNAG